MRHSTLKTEYAQIFEGHGFQVSAVVDLEFLSPDSKSPLQQDLDHFKSWLEQGGSADMHYMRENLEAREDYNKILPGVRSVILFAVPYATGNKVRGGTVRKTNLANDAETQIPEQSILNVTARYARGKDYHRTLRKQIELCAESLKNALPDDSQTRVVIDTVPFLERAHGREGGLGFVGKNTMLIRPGLGSYFFIVSLFTTAAAAEMTIAENERPALKNLSCGECRKCLDACPTGALSKPYFLDAGKCISYLTIENRGTIASEFIPHLAENFYGCDICQEACPYNISTLDLRSITSVSEPHGALMNVTARDVARMTEAQYEDWFGGTAMTRAKYSGLVRNALYHLWAKRDGEIANILNERAQDAHPLIRSTAKQLLETQ